MPKLILIGSELYKNLESIFVALGNDLVPFFIEKILLQKGNQLRILFEDVSSEGDANAVMESELYLLLEFLPELTGNKFYFHEASLQEYADEIDDKYDLIISNPPFYNAT